MSLYHEYVTLDVWMDNPSRPELRVHHNYRRHRQALMWNVHGTISLDINDRVLPFKLGMVEACVFMWIHMFDKLLSKDTARLVAEYLTAVKIKDSFKWHDEFDQLIKSQLIIRISQS